MTRRGSLAYYFAAIVCGCFFLAVAVVLGEWRFRFFDLYFVYFLSLAYGWLFALVYALLLRHVTRIAARFLPRGRLLWAVAGAGIAVVLMGSFSGIWELTRQGAALPGPPLMWIMVFGGGVGMIAFAKNTALAVGSAIFMGAATACVLHRIDRAFAEQE